MPPTTSSTVRANPARLNAISSVLRFMISTPLTGPTRDLEPLVSRRSHHHRRHHHSARDPKPHPTGPSTPTHACWFDKNVRPVLARVAAAPRGLPDAGRRPL